jgi:hypothetical protein
VPKIGALAVEVWTTNGGIRFDNFVVSYSEAAAAKYAEATWKSESIPCLNFMSISYRCYQFKLMEALHQVTCPQMSVKRNDNRVHLRARSKSDVVCGVATEKFDAETSAETAAKKETKAKERETKKQEGGWRNLAEVYLQEAVREILCNTPIPRPIAANPLSQPCRGVIPGGVRERRAPPSYLRQ